MRANLDHPAEQVIDARAPTRFRGDEPEHRPGVAPGHIPGSRNLPYARLFHDDGTWKRGPALAAEFRAAGIDVDRSEEHTSELQSLMRTSYAVSSLKTKTQQPNT